MRLLLAVLLAGTLTACGSGGGAEDADVVGTIEIVSGKAANARCLLLRSGDETYHLAPGAYTLMPGRGSKQAQQKVVQASRLMDDGVSTAELRHGAEIRVQGKVRSAPDDDPCDVEKVLSVEELGR